MYMLSVLSTGILMIVCTIFYIVKAWKKDTDPTPTTWILMAVVMSLSVWMYIQSPRHSWTANIGIFAGICSTGPILIAVLIIKLRDKTLHLSFNGVQKVCLTAGVAVVLLWFFTANALLSYILVQIIAVVAYVATIVRLWKATSIKEPLFFWYVAFAGTLSAAYPAWVTRDPFSIAYLARAIPCTLIMIYMIHRIHHKMPTQALAHE